MEHSAPCQARANFVRQYLAPAELQCAISTSHGSKTTWFMIYQAGLYFGTVTDQQLEKSNESRSQTKSVCRALITTLF
jgi:hypothetical protein